MTDTNEQRFSRSYEDIIASLEDSIRYGVEQPVDETFVFKSDTRSYELQYEVQSITSVTGLVEKKFTVFAPNTDYRVDRRRLIWVNFDRHPDEGTRLSVDYTYRAAPSGLTDFNPGSVVGTLVRAFSRELKLLYEQMIEAYRRAFIDNATGFALDNVVALMGVLRNPPTKAVGEVTFYREAPADAAVTVPAGTIISDEGGRLYTTTLAGTLQPRLEEYGTLLGGQIIVRNYIAEIVSIQQLARQGGDLVPALELTASAPIDEENPFGEDNRTITIEENPDAESVENLTNQVLVAQCHRTRRGNPTGTRWQRRRQRDHCDANAAGRHRRGGERTPHHRRQRPRRR
jgi:hypothetical protein